MLTGRHSMVVMTHKAEAEDITSVTEKIHIDTNIPKENIWAFDNYTTNKENGKISINYRKDKSDGNQRQVTEEKHDGAACVTKGKDSKDEGKDTSQRQEDKDGNNMGKTEGFHDEKVQEARNDKSNEDDLEEKRITNQPTDVDSIDTDGMCDQEEGEGAKVEKTKDKKGWKKIFKKGSKDKKAHRGNEGGHQAEEVEKFLKDDIKENEDYEEDISKDHEGRHQEKETINFEDKTPDKSNIAKENLEEPEKDGAASKGNTTHIHQGDSKGTEQEDEKEPQQEKGGNQQESQQSECTVEESMGKHDDTKSKKKDKDKKKKDKKDQKKDKKKGRKGKESQENEVVENVEKLGSGIGIRSEEEPPTNPTEKVTGTDDDRRIDKDGKDPVLSTPENINELGHEEEQIKEDKPNETLAAHNDCQMGTEEPGTSDRKEDEENDFQESTVTVTEVDEDGKGKKSKGSKPKKDKENKNKQKEKGDQETGATDQKRSALGRWLKTNKKKSEEIPQNIDIEGNKELVNGSEIDSKDEHHIEVDPRSNVQEHDEHQRESTNENAPAPNTDIDQQETEKQALKRQPREKTECGDQMDTDQSEKALTDDKEGDQEQLKESTDRDTEGKEVEDKPQNLQEEEGKENKTDKQEDEEPNPVQEKKKAKKGAWPLKIPGIKAKKNEEIKGTGKLHEQEDADGCKEDNVLQQGSQQSPEMGAGHDDTVIDEETPNKYDRKTPIKYVAEIRNNINIKFQKFRPGGHKKLQHNAESEERITEIADEVDEKKHEKSQEELEEEKRNIEFLEFIWACLEMAERNISHKQDLEDEEIVELEVGEKDSNKHWYSRFKQR